NLKTGQIKLPSEEEPVRGKQKRPLPESQIKKNTKKITFISYSHIDKEFVERLTIDLEDEGISVWVDEKEIKVGESISQKLEEGISVCNYFCIVISKDSINSKWVQREYSTAINAQLSPGTTPTILPLLFQNVELPVFLKDIKYADFSKSYNKGLTKLLDAIKEK
ncbi:MAG: toll/interleukin-1 receptor domain-containing protein, partial [bacterium]|nr:toll/interleukin-1 receptor domain-containing protein [bacterium]